MWRLNSPEEPKDGEVPPGQRWSSANSRTLEQPGCSEEHLQCGDSMKPGREAQADPSTTAPAATAEADTPSNLASNAVSILPAASATFVEPVSTKMDTGLYQLEAAAPAPRLPTAAALPPALQDGWAADVPSAASFVLPSRQPATQLHPAEIPESPVLLTVTMQQQAARAAGAEPWTQPAPGVLSAEPQPNPQLRASQRGLNSGHASEDLELALQSLLAVPEIPRASSATSSDERGPEAERPTPMRVAAGVDMQAAPAPSPAAPNRRRSSVAGQAPTLAARGRRSLRTTATGRHAEAHQAIAATASPLAAGLEPAARPAGGEPADGSADILAELEAQRARHAEQVGPPRFMQAAQPVLPALHSRRPCCLPFCRLQPLRHPMKPGPLCTPRLPAHPACRFVSGAWSSEPPPAHRRSCGWRARCAPSWSP